MLSKKRTAALLLAAAMLGGCADTASGGAAAEDEPAEGYIDSLTPGKDFYGYINARDLMETELADGEICRGTMIDPAFEVDDQLDRIIDETVNSTEDFPRGSNEQLIRDLYRLAYDQLNGTLDTDSEDTAVVDGILDMIESAGTVDDLKEMWHTLSSEYGISAFIQAGNTINIYDSSEYITMIGYYPPDDLESMKEDQLYAISFRDELTDVLKTAGVSPEDAKQRATDIVYMMYEVASHTDFDIVNNEKQPYDCFNIFTREEWDSHSHNLSFDDIMYSVGMSGEFPDKVTICDPEQINVVDSLIDEEHIDEWKDLAICKVLTTFKAFLPEKYSRTAPDGVKPDRLAKELVKSLLETQMGEEYAERYLSEEKCAAITEMCNDMREEYRVLISGADWLTEEGRAFLLKKLDNMLFYVGADEPHETDPADADMICPTILQTAYRYKATGVKENFDLIGTDPGRNGYEQMTSSTVNACYIVNMNCISIPSAILSKPIFDEDADYFDNLGSIGSIVAHEISHAFDSKGVLFDENGNYRPDAMPEADKDAFRELQEKASEYYSRFTVLGTHVNGKLTLAENFADLSGVQCVLAIAKTPEEKKKVFEGFARVWKSLTEDVSAKESLETDVHSPDIVRVNAVVACFDEFYEIYGVKEGDPMYVAPEERIRRW